MSYKRYETEQSTLQPIPDDVRVEMTVYLTGLKTIRDLLDNATGTTRTELQQVLEQEAPREREMYNLLKAGGIQTITTNDFAVRINKALDAIESELTAYNTYLAKYGPKA